jgi:hypothetical protein
VLRQSTQVIVVIGPFVDVTDGFTPETGITLSGADEAEILKANTSTTTDISGATWAAITGCDGYYALTLTTTLTDTIGPLTVMVNDDSVCLPVFARFQVIEEAAYDTIYAASALPASTTNITAGTVTTATNVTTVNGLAANVITATSIAADAITAAKIAAGAIDAATFAADVDAEILSYIVDDATRIDASALNTAAVTSIPAILADTGTDGVVVAAASKTGYTLSAAGLADFFDTDSLTTYASAVAGSVVKEIADNAGGGTPPTAAAIADAVWDEAQADHVTAGSFGEVATEVAAILVDTGTTLDGLITTVDTVVDAIKVQTDKFVFTVANQVDANVQSINDTALTGNGGVTPWGPA